ncbi:MAG: hypothetical protein E4H10_12385 [Bacteroidia bacterium]|nr:MAG: hypothetical protein E4H10_12385 [Bacteroidia bacterium]
MKKVVIILGLLLFFSGFAVAQTGTEAYFDQSYLDLELYCGDVYYDHLLGMVEIHFMMHFKDGEMTWFKVQGVKASLVSVNGETFTIKEVDKVNGPFPWNSVFGFPTHTFHYNIVGETGNRFIGSGTFDWETGLNIYNRAMCPGSM